MRQNKDGSEYYDIKCDVFDRRTGVAFNFYLTDIVSFYDGHKETIIKREQADTESQTSSKTRSEAGTEQVVPLVDQGGGIFMVPVLINGVITLNFLIDSGASSVSVPSDVVSTLIRAGTIRKDAPST